MLFEWILLFTHFLNYTRSAFTIIIVQSRRITIQNLSIIVFATESITSTTTKTKHCKTGKRVCYYNLYITDIICNNVINHFNF